MITIVLPVPPTTNHTYGVNSGRMYKNADATSWEREAMYYISKNKPKTRTGKVKVGVLWVLKHDRDIDGGIKIILDALQHNSVIDNDRKIYKLTVEKEIRKNITMPLVVVTISDYIDEGIRPIPTLAS